MRVPLIALVWAATIVSGVRAIAASDLCGLAIAETRSATERLQAYTSRMDASTTEALDLTRQVGASLERAMSACAETDKEAGLRFSAMSMEMIEAGLRNAKTEKLHDLGIFMPPDEP
jgi:hypothetical protein